MNSIIRNSIIRSIFQFDLFLTRFINELMPHNYFFDLIFSFFSMKGGSIAIWIAIVVLLIIFEEKINKKFILYFLVTLGISSLLVFGLKNIIQRPRPIQADSNRFQLIQPISTVCPNDFSFPSGHATTAFVAATVLSAFDKKRKREYYVIASLVGLSRIYLGCHYLLDIIAGGFIGYFISSIMLLTFYQKKKVS